MRRFILAVISLTLAAACAGPVAATAGKSQTASGSLTDQLKSPDPKVRAKAARELGKEGNISSIPALSAALSDSEPKVRREVVIALAQMHGPQVLEALIKATHDQDDGARMLAVKSLVGYYTGDVPKHGFTAFVKKTWKGATAHFEMDTKHIPPGIVVDPNVVSALVAVMNANGAPNASEEAAKGLGILGAQAAVPDLVKAAHSSDSALALEALNALSKIKDRSAGPQLFDLLGSPNHDIKRTACVTVGILRANEAVPKLQSIFESDSNQKDRENALTGLAYLGQSISEPTFIKALWSHDKKLRVGGAEGLARVADPKTLSELEKAAITEKDTDAKLAMEFAITAVGKDTFLNDLVTELGSHTRGDVATAYLTELARNPQFLPKLYPFLQSPDATVRRRLCGVLMYSGDQSSLAQLDRLEHDPNADVAAEALRAKQAIRARLAPGTGVGRGN